MTHDLKLMWKIMNKAALIRYVLATVVIVTAAIYGLANLYVSFMMFLLYFCIEAQLLVNRLFKASFGQIYREREKSDKLLAALCVQVVGKKLERKE